MDGIDDSADAAPDDDITGGAGSEAQAQNTAAAGGDAQAGSGEIRFAAGDGEMRGDAAPGGVSDEAVDSAAATLGGIQAAASRGEAASGSAIDAVGGKRRREEGGEGGAVRVARQATERRRLAIRESSGRISTHGKRTPGNGRRMGKRSTSESLVCSAHRKGVTAVPSLTRRPPRTPNRNTN